MVATTTTSQSLSLLSISSALMQVHQSAAMATSTTLNTPTTATTSTRMISALDTIESFLFMGELSLGESLDMEESMDSAVLSRTAIQLPSLSSNNDEHDDDETSSSSNVTIEDDEAMEETTAVAHGDAGSFGELREVKYYYATWTEGQLCSSKTTSGFEMWEESHGSLSDCCEMHFGWDYDACCDSLDMGGCS